MARKNFMGTLIVLSIMLEINLLPSKTFAASFNCNNAKNDVENAVCFNPILSKLDELVSLSYKRSLIVHPMPEYVQARQIYWLSGNPFCDVKNFINCLEHSYLGRETQLIDKNDLTVFANSEKFSFANGDAVVEYWTEDGTWRFSIWGGFVIHRLETELQKRPVYTGCEFEGFMKDPADGLAVNVNGDVVHFVVEANTMTIENEDIICSGFGRLPGSFKKVTK
jgi:uncharacterized protein